MVEYLLASLVDNGTAAYMRESNFNGLGEPDGGLPTFVRRQWRVRVCVSRPLQPIIGKVHMTKALGTADRDTAYPITNPAFREIAVAIDAQVRNRTYWRVGSRTSPTATSVSG